MTMTAGAVFLPCCQPHAESSEHQTSPVGETLPVSMTDVYFVIIALLEADMRTCIRLAATLTVVARSVLHLPALKPTAPPPIGPHLCLRCHGHCRRPLAPPPPRPEACCPICLAFVASATACAVAHSLLHLLVPKPAAPAHLTPPNLEGSSSLDTAFR
ncbi:hypothetical protein GUJ93_ZPchr0014g47037 [Zizania palustris]|uniref:Uncharacterized protein n=1 Tax=Zizania palustris TaxID=103762 RepID=A0A8J5SVK5_ZIZPA|nr:hypothetical protein GUJ93_ZPchr0014g47037 [Zizania palustris]